MNVQLNEQLESRVWLMDLDHLGANFEMSVLSQSLSLSLSPSSFISFLSSSPELSIYLPGTIK